ncbi:MAG: hypothetical protein ABI843_04050 [Dokdonella sp.]
MRLYQPLFPAALAARLFPGVFAALLLVACAAPSYVPAPSANDVRTDRTDKAFDLDPAITRVAIDNPWGEITIRGRDEREVGIHAVIQRNGPHYAKPAFRSHREGDTLHVEIGFDGSTAGTHAAGRIDAAVFVPGELALTLSTRDSRIAAKRRAGAIEASSDSGDILASSYGRLTLRTNSGLIRATAIGARWNGASTIESASGRIVLLVPTFGDIALDVQTGGALSTNFGLSVHATPAGGSQARARYGAGTSQLRVRSGSGEVVLEQLVLLGEDNRLPEDDD